MMGGACQKTHTRPPTVKFHSRNEKVKRSNGTLMLEIRK